jgi:rare lipoprotein A
MKSYFNLVYKSILPVFGCIYAIFGLTACTNHPNNTVAPQHDVVPDVVLNADTVQDSKPDVVLHPNTIQNAVPRDEIVTKAGNTSPYTVLNQTYTVLPPEAIYSEEGLASWYGTKFHGRPTANGEIYSMFDATAAHRSLPIPSYAKVTNLNNGREIIVRVNDRGPFHSERIIDLSYAAAIKLGFAEQGVARVHIERIDTRGLHDQSASISPNTQQHYYLQAGAFSNKATAENLITELQSFIAHPIEIPNTNDQLHRVWIGPLIQPSDIRHINALFADQQRDPPQLISR